MPCTTILAGKKATNDGSTIISRNDDGLFQAKKIIVKPAAKQPKKYRTVISHLTVELPDDPMRYTCAPNVSTKNGVWPACGINEANVAMTATETITSNPRVMGADPYIEYKPKKGRKQKEVPGGIGEEDIVTLVLPYIKSAREGVLRLGELLERYGTYEPNGIAFCDSDDVWWMETIGGHHWIAKRVPDERVVIMPNQFGMDEFDFDDAFGSRKENLCSADLREFIEANHLYTGNSEGKFNPRLAFGSRSDSDHIYNTPRAWFLARNFLERSYRWDGDGADFTPESNDIPWSFVPERKVTVEEVRYLLGSHYQGTPYDPYDKKAEKAGKYRTIGVPNSDVCGIMQIRGNMPGPLKGVEWFSMGGSGFTCCFPFYAQVGTLPDYISKTTDTVSTERMYWTSRIIAALTDAHYGPALIHDERYQNAVWNKGQKLLCEYDAKVLAGESAKLLEEANKKITDMVKEESEKALGNILGVASEHMKIRYHRGDN
ncbi:MAG: C69 family dipeptidase [Lachnospiraceae bacterium]|nr:C69 family dipeptidase [Lachnospiraceae bacterium]